MLRALVALTLLFPIASGLGAEAAEDATPEQASPSRAAVAFEHFIRRNGALCLSSPSTDCFAQGWRFADRNGDGALALEELTEIRGELLEWTEWRGESLRGGERLGISTGIWIVDSVGLPTLFAGFDSDGSGDLSQKELLADVRLDERPIAKVLLDPKAVDRKAIAGRLGKLSPMLDALLKPK